MSRTYFGTDGIRGTVGQPPITPDFVLRLAHAVGRVLKKTESRPTVLIGKDTRISGYMLESALESGFNSAGVDVVLLGPLPTPGVAYLTRAQRASLGVVISASHNPFPDNGIKFFSAHGTKLPDEWEIAVEAVLQEAPVWADSATLGKAKRLDDAPGRYIEFCKSTFANDLTLRNMTIVVDAAHGAAYQIAPKVFHELGAEVVVIGCSPDGLNINDKVGATHPQALVDAVKANGAHFGIALDGDADRPAAGGRERAALQRRRTVVPDGRRPPEPGRTSAWRGGNADDQHGRGSGAEGSRVEFVRAKVGDRYVLEELEKRRWILGGEGSGHLLALDKHTRGLA
jgi:phosphoglucosamine mutase